MTYEEPSYEGNFVLVNRSPCLLCQLYNTHNGFRYFCQAVLTALVYQSQYLIDGRCSNLIM